MRLGIVGDMITCAHCGALAPAASRFCPACGEAFDSESRSVGDSDAESMPVAEQLEAIDFQGAPSGDVLRVPLSAREAISKGRFILLYVNVALLCILVGLTISNTVIPPVRAEDVSATPTATATILATDTPVESTPTRHASPTPTTAAARAIPTVPPPAPKPSPTATSIPTATFAPPPPPPSAPTPTPTPRPK